VCTSDVFASKHARGYVRRASSVLYFCIFVASSAVTVITVIARLFRRPVGKNYKTVSTRWLTLRVHTARGECSKRTNKSKIPAHASKHVTSERHTNIPGRRISVVRFVTFTEKHAIGERGCEKKYYTSSREYRTRYSWVSTGNAVIGSPGLVIFIVIIFFFTAKLRRRCDDEEYRKTSAPSRDDDKCPDDDGYYFHFVFRFVSIVRRELRFPYVPRNQAKRVREICVDVCVCVGVTPVASF